MPRATSFASVLFARLSPRQLAPGGWKTLWGPRPSTPAALQWAKPGVWQVQVHKRGSRHLAGKVAQGGPARPLAGCDSPASGECGYTKAPLDCSRSTGLWRVQLHKVTPGLWRAQLPNSDPASGGWCPPSLLLVAPDPFFPKLFNIPVRLCFFPPSCQPAHHAAASFSDLQFVGSNKRHSALCSR